MKDSRKNVRNKVKYIVTRTYDNKDIPLPSALNYLPKFSQFVFSTPEEANAFINRDTESIIRIYPHERITTHFTNPYPLSDATVTIGNEKLIVKWDITVGYEL